MFDAPDLIARAGLIPTIQLAERCGLPALVAEKVRLTGAKKGAGTAADAKALSIVGGMVAGADSIDDLDVLRHGGLPRLFGGVRAPSALGTFLRPFTWGQVRQLEAAMRAFTCRLATHTGLVPTGDEVVFVDIDSKVKPVYGPQTPAQPPVQCRCRQSVPHRFSGGYNAALITELVGPTGGSPP
ncbi:hypothetical protein [Streptomyces sp. NPDC097610]|uniref:hypothetical protein n=1 Tax=Streptomyces sp. NPDC097610 TaxID=3157227 RepID=UPI00332FE391